MTAAFTPGPWEPKARYHPADAFHIMWEERGQGWVRDRRLDRDCSGGFTAEDARLIAAAPDLLAALEAFVDNDTGDTIDTRYENARQAICKARGGQ